MANIGAINKILKLKKILLPMTAHSSFLACGSVRHQRTMLTRSQCQQQKSKSTQNRYYSSNKSPADTVSISEAPTLDEFRAREEQREQDFERQHREEEQRRQAEGEADSSEKVNAIRLKILEAALPHVTQLGWTRKAIIQGSEEAGYPTVAHGIFPEGGYALVAYFQSRCNEELFKWLQQETDFGKKPVTDVQDFLVRALRTRLEMVIPYKQQWPQALALIALPQNAKTALAQVLTLVDDVCYFSGDRSVDFEWYTRRIGLATIWKLTELFMLQDTSASHEKTWEFLQNRMTEAIQIEKILAQGGDASQIVQSSFKSAFITARNILGLNYNRR